MLKAIINLAESKESFIAMACNFSSDITSMIDGKIRNAKSIMNAPYFENNQIICIEINGIDEQLAMREIKRKYHFKEEEKNGR